jgi:MoxR-like ATPase
MFKSVEDTLEQLQRVNYFTDMETAAAIYLAGSLNRPILLEGPAGAGKTEMALAVMRATKMQLIRLQCFDGLTDKEAIGDTSMPLQQLFMQMHKGTFEEACAMLANRRFFAPGPLVRALESPERCILLIDEIDKISHAFEASLLEILNDWQVTIPSIGMTVTTEHPPFTIVTANDERQLGYPMLRRCVRVYINHPTPEKETDIIRNRTPHVSHDLHLFIAGFAKTLRGWPMEKPPSISEMITLVLALDLLHVSEIRNDHKSVILPFIAKTERDRKYLLTSGRFDSLMENARKEAAAMKEVEIKQLTLQAAELRMATEELVGDYNPSLTSTSMQPPPPVLLPPERTGIHSRQNIPLPTGGVRQ